MASQPRSSHHQPPDRLQDQNSTRNPFLLTVAPLKVVSRATTRMGRTNYSLSEDLFITYHRLYTQLTWGQLAEEFGWRWKARSQGSLQARWNELKNSQRLLLPTGYVLPPINYPIALANELVYLSRGPYYE